MLTCVPPPLSRSPHVLAFLFRFLGPSTFPMGLPHPTSLETPWSFTIFTRTPVDYRSSRPGEEIMLLKELGIFSLYARYKGHGPTLPWHAHQTPTVYHKHNFLLTLLRGRIESDACSMVDIHPYLVPCYSSKTYSIAAVSMISYPMTLNSPCRCGVGLTRRKDPIILHCSSSDLSSSPLESHSTDGLVLLFHYPGIPSSLLLSPMTCQFSWGKILP